MPRWKKISGNPPNPRHPRSILLDTDEKFMLGQIDVHLQEYHVIIMYSKIMATQ
jgi:hypothetical protein